MKVKIMSFKSKTIARLTFAAALILTGCKNELEPELTINSVSIYTAQDANQNSATAVDLVVIYDQNLVKSIGKMSASQYFSNTQQLLLDNPTLIDIWHWELVPGQIVQAFTPEAGDTEAYAAYVFANYLTGGDHRLKVAPSGIVAILLQKNDLLNLSTENLVAANPGTTMADAVKTTQSTSTCYQGPQVNLGTTTDTYSSYQSPCCGTTATQSALVPPNSTTAASSASQVPCGTMAASPTSKTPCGSTSTPPTSKTPCSSTTATPTYKAPCSSTPAPSSPSCSMSGAGIGQPVLKQPIPIATRPLKIPPALRKNTSGSKVKNG